MCHGWEGTGAPTAGRTFPPDIKLPTNFADAAWQAARSDGELFWVLIHGSHGTDMVAYMPQYIRTRKPGRSLPISEHSEEPKGVSIFLGNRPDLGSILSFIYYI